MTRFLLTFLLVCAACLGQTRSQRVATAADAIRDKVVAQRRDFHQHPELSNREERTARVVAERLRALGMDEVKTAIGKRGVVALLKGGKPGPVIAWRADMAALPIIEDVDVPYKSQNPGIHHACGHDAHMAIALGVAEVLSAMRDLINGSVKFIFQPAEEGAPDGEQGGLRTTRVRRFRRKTSINPSQTTYPPASPPSRIGMSTTSGETKICPQSSAKLAVVVASNAPFRYRRKVQFRKDHHLCRRCYGSTE